MIVDPIARGLKSGWKVIDASKLDRDVHLEADVAIVGTGAGGGTAAEILSAAGLHVVMIEEGPLKSSSDFHMLEREAYPTLYQESAARQTKDKGITILQGRSVGGSTTVNWTSSFRTPSDTLAYWRQHYGLERYTPELLAPWFELMEQRLSIHRWQMAPNENNAALQRGAAKVGIPTAVIPRNVKGCQNLGYCGMGCPVNAKQSMLVTTIPAALERGSVLVHHARAERFTLDGDEVSGLICSALDSRDQRNLPYQVTVRAKTYVAAAGAIGSPALLLRSHIPNPHRHLGKRTFLHPVVLSAAIMPEAVDGFSGAPQSIYSDHFLDTQSIDGPIGYKLEVPPIHPLLAAVTMPGFGPQATQNMDAFARTQVIIALMRDGFSEQSTGGNVELRRNHAPVLDYPITPYVWEGMRRAYLTMAQIQFAAGAKSVMPIHESAFAYTSWPQAQAQIAALPMEILLARVVSAHVMGGCAMGADEHESVVSGNGRHHIVGNLYVFDGSVFPTSLGVNPQLSIYGIVARNANLLASSLLGKPLEKRIV
ncbi:MAG TPA: GMC family oxidoreductase [Candidatus Baltobacteraceae bacterium]|nr:GMC family oxidoreductase [Candidatus Baltobacteraceae bacterium]